MINSRNLNDLLPEVKELALHHKDLAAHAGIDIIFTSTFRDNECQDALYAEGRTVPGKIVTNARAGESFHNYRVAYDIVIIRNGKPVWDSSDPDWQVVGKLGQSIGLDWAGMWTGKLKETAHFQKAGLSLSELKANPLSRS